MFSQKLLTNLRESIGLDFDDNSRDQSFYTMDRDKLIFHVLLGSGLESLHPKIIELKNNPNEGLQGINNYLRSAGLEEYFVLIQEIITA